jgi:ATP-dependent DNA helicase RecG
MVARNPKIDALTKILRKEREDGFQDSAVYGGLDRFLERSASELRPVLGEPGSYSKLTPPQREEWATQVMRRLTQETPPATNISQFKAVSRPQVRQQNTTPPTQKPQIPRPQVRQQKAPSQNRKPPVTKASLDDDINRLRSVTKQSLPRLKRLGIQAVRDLVYHFPHRHNDFANMRNVAQLVPGEEQTVIATVWEASVTQLGKRESTQAILGDETGNFRVIWFNNRWIARSLPPGTEVVISGKAEIFQGRKVFTNPEYEFLRDQDNLVHTGRLVPVYPLTDGLYQRTMRRVVKEAIDAALTQVPEFLPDDMKHRTGLMSIQNAIAQMHYPDSQQDLANSRRRLGFDEMFLLQMAVIKRRQSWQEQGRGIKLDVNRELLDAFLDSLPYALTSAQVRVLGEILEDLQRDRPMSRLIQGDVGSGKTVVATAAMLVAIFSGCQGAFMAPTEILAEQHFLTITKMLSDLPETSENEYLVSVELEPLPRPINVGLLIGSLSKRAKDEMHERIAEGKVDIIIGTQALIQSGVEIPNLALVVVDEQHRFGVMQRASLREKGTWPHLLAMSATPIPRSLALTVYGDLDLSTIDEMPPGRQQIRTRWVEPERRHAAYGLVKKEVEQGRQAFIVFPLIDESETIQARAATEEYERLSTQVFPDLKLGLLHGRMALSEKEEVMEQFQQGELDILISTPVVEVGIDVPNATVMLIESADHFGLAQLHQFRGRVGRGQHQSHCLLLADNPGEEARERLKIMQRVLDGFQLAEEDLRIRGPGDYLGTRQSGLPDLKVARISDQDILALARREAIKLLEADPELKREENAALAERFRTYEAGLSGEIS